MMDEEQERGTKMKGRTYFYSSSDDGAFFGGTDTIKEAFESLPPREAWIEIPKKGRVNLKWMSRFPRGKRGLK